MISTSRFLRSCLLVIALAPVGVFAGEILVTGEWLAGHLDDEHLVVLHVGREETYADSHIPGARFVNTHADLSDPHSHGEGALVLEMPSPTLLEEKLEALGIGDESLVVLYFSDDDITNTTRAVFTLDWAGLGERVRLLDGGLDAWKAAGGSVTDEVPEVAPGELTITPRPELVVDAEWVRRHAGDDGLRVLDARSRSHYDGVRKDQGRPGHIPHAGSLPWPELVTHELKFKDPEALRALFEGAGVEPGDRVAAYCHIGQYATAVLFAARVLGFDVALYDGAIQDWNERKLPLSVDPS